MTRAEVDHAHTRKIWLKIEVPLLQNVLNVSPYKSLTWALFGLSSVLIHLLFNSSVFTVDYSGSKWSMALVSESFLHNEPYFLPGAGLTLSGTVCDISDTENYNFGVYNDDSQYSSQRLATVMAIATQNLSVTKCKFEYQACQGLHKYRNLLLVIGIDNGPTDSQGWVISDIYDMEDTVGNVYNVSALASAMELSDNKLQNETFRSIWEPYFEDTSMSQSNSLWFSSTCYKVADRSADGCDNICGSPIGTSQSYY